MRWAFNPPLLLVVFLFLLCGSSFGKGLPFDVIPYAYYDPNFGFAGGLFSSSKNLFLKNESFTFYVEYDQQGGIETALAGSFADKSFRHKTLFPFAFDFETLFGKRITDRFYGFGSGTPSTNYSTFDNDYHQFKLFFSRAVKNNLVLGSSLQFVGYSFSNISEDAYPITQEMIDLSRQYLVGGFDLKFFNTDELSNPKKGENICINLDFGIKGAGSLADFNRLKFDFRKYITLFKPDQVLAGRLVLTGITGNSIPLFEYASLGGKHDLRGYTRYRFRGNASALFNLECRFPLFANWGGVIFFDTGKVFENLDNLDLNHPAADFGFGLRLYLTKLLLRLDYGISNEGGKIYLFYNHLF